MSSEFDAKNLINISEEDEHLWELLSAYVDGETTPAESAIVEAHLRSDAAYAQDFAFLKSTARQVIQIGEATPPTELRDAIFAATIHKPTFSRRLAQAMAQMQSAVSPRYALPAGALAAGVLAAFLFVPRTADNHTNTVSAQPPTVAAVPNTNSLKTSKAIEPIIPKGTQNTPQVANNDSKASITLPKQSEIDIVQRLSNAPTGEKATTSVSKKLNDSKIAFTLTSKTDKTPTIQQKLNTAGMKSESPMPKKSDMFDQFTPVPNMDRENQRTITRIDPPTEPPLNEDVTPIVADTTPAENPVASASANVESPTRTFRVYSTRRLPDSRRIATGSQFRTEQSEFQQGISRSTMLAMQRDELSGSTVTRF